VGDMRENPQLDLAVVGRDQQVAGLGDEGFANAAALLGAHRDILQVRVGRGDAPGGGAGDGVGVRISASELQQSLGSV